MEDRSEGISARTRIVARYGASRIETRIERTLLNPNISPFEKQELLLLASLTKVCLDHGLVSLMVHFGKQFVELSDSLIPPEKPTGERR